MLNNTITTKDITVFNSEFSKSFTTSNEPINVFVWLSSYKDKYEYQFAWNSENSGLCMLKINKEDLNIKQLKEIIHRSGHDNFVLITALTPNQLFTKDTMIDNGLSVEDMTNVMRENLKIFFHENHLPFDHFEEERPHLSECSYDFLIHEHPLNQDKLILKLFASKNETMKEIINSFSPLKLSVIESFSNLMPNTFLSRQNKISDLNNTLCLYADKERCIAYFTLNNTVKSFEIPNSAYTNLNDVYKYFVQTHNLNLEQINIMYYKDKALDDELIPNDWIEIDNSVPLIPLCILSYTP